MRDWWEVLSVQPDAPPEVVDAAYRAMAKRLHPDAGGNADSMEEVNAAYARAVEDRRRGIKRYAPKADNFWERLFGPPPPVSEISATFDPQARTWVTGERVAFCLHAIDPRPFGQLLYLVVHNIGDRPLRLDYHQMAVLDRLGVQHNSDSVASAWRTSGRFSPPDGWKERIDLLDKAVAFYIAFFPDMPPQARIARLVWEIPVFRKPYTEGTVRGAERFDISAEQLLSLPGGQA